jgi:hypothetical protein
LWIKIIWKDSFCIIYKRNSQSLFWTYQTLNMGTIRHRCNFQAIFKFIHVCCRISTSVCLTAFLVGVCCMLQHTNVNCPTVWIINSDAMNPQEKVQCMEWFIKTEFDTQVQRRSVTFQNTTPSRPLIHARYKQFKDIGVFCIRKVHHILLLSWSDYDIQQLPGYAGKLCVHSYWNGSVPCSSSKILNHKIGAWLWVYLLISISQTNKLALLVPSIGKPYHQISHPVIFSCGVLKKNCLYKFQRTTSMISRRELKPLLQQLALTYCSDHGWNLNIAWTLHAW